MHLEGSIANQKPLDINEDIRVAGNEWTRRINEASSEEWVGEEDKGEFIIKFKEEERGVEFSTNFEEEEVEFSIKFIDKKTDSILNTMEKKD